MLQVATLDEALQQLALVRPSKSRVMLLAIIVGITTLLAVWVSFLGWLAYSGFCWLGALLF